MAKFKVGDRVVAKGIDGPVMLVNSVSSNGENLGCYWFSGKKKEVSNFHADTLKAAPDEID